MIRSFLIALGSLFIATSVFAADLEQDIPHEFKSIARQVLQDLEENHPDLIRKFSKTYYSAVLEKIQIVVVDNELVKNVSPTFSELLFQQSGIALNSREQMTVWIQRTRWQSIQDSYIKAGIVLHEILCFIPNRDPEVPIFTIGYVETTGAYPVSAAYITRLKLNARLKGTP